jgi:hypothetical protein
MFAAWVTQIVGQRKAIVVAMDWTDSDADDQTVIRPAILALTQLR